MSSHSCTSRTLTCLESWLW